MSHHPALPASRGRVIDAIRGAKEISRVELVRLMGSNAATISTVVRSLIDDGLVVESGRAASTGGKPPVLLALAPDSRYAVGVSLDHSGISYVVANLGGAIVGRLRRRGYGAETPEEVVQRIDSEMTSLVDHVGVDMGRVLGVGVVSPGPITGSNGMALTPPAMSAWRDFPLADTLAARTGFPVLIENDASAAAVGEYWAGPGAGSSCFAAFYMGTGIGAGLVFDGVLHRGASGNTGEIGHICIDLTGPECWCGARGCLEVVAGPTAVVDAAAARGVSLPGRTVVEDFAALARRATEGDPVAVDLIDRSAEGVAVAVQSLANIVDPDLVVLTGPAFTAAGSLYLPRIQRRLDSAFFARACHRVEVLLSPNAAEAAAIGAAAMVLQSELAPGPPGATAERRGSGRPLQRV